MINLEQLSQFLSVVQRKNFTHAASDLYISHSTISRSIAKLEAQMGTQLLVRNNRSVSLTPAGELLAQRGKLLISEADALEKDVRAMGQKANSRLRIDMINIYSQDLFRLWGVFHQKYPTVSTSIKYVEMAEVEPRLANGDADIGVTFSFNMLPQNIFDHLPFATGEFVVLVSSDHPLAQRSFIDIRDPQLELPMMLETHDYPFVKNISVASPVFRDSLQTARKVQSLNDMFLEVKANMGICFLPEHVAAQSGRGCSMLSLDGVDTSYSLCMFWLKSATNAAISSFVELFKDISPTPPSEAEPRD